MLTRHTQPRSQFHCTNRVLCTHYRREQPFETCRHRHGGHLISQSIKSIAQSIQISYRLCATDELTALLNSSLEDFGRQVVPVEVLVQIFERKYNMDAITVVRESSCRMGTKKSLYTDTTQSSNGMTPDTRRHFVLRVVSSGVVIEGTVNASS